MLHKLEVEYTTDPKNAHRFTFEEDQQALVSKKDNVWVIMSCNVRHVTQIQGLDKLVQ